MKKVFYRCPDVSCSFDSVIVHENNSDSTSLFIKCERCDTPISWYKITYGESRAYKEDSMQFIGPLQSYVELGMKGGPKEIHRKSELREYARENNKILASSQEIAQESVIQQRHRQDEANVASHQRILNRIVEINKRYGR